MWRWLGLARSKPRREPCSSAGCSESQSREHNLSVCSPLAWLLGKEDVHRLSL